MTDQNTAPAAAPGEQTPAPATPALVEHVRAIAEGAAKVEAEAASLPAVITGDARQSVARVETLATKIEAWFVEEIHNSPVSRAGAEIFNHLRQAVNSLKTRLGAL
jgi:hypothetical protein